MEIKDARGLFDELVAKGLVDKPLKKTSLGELKEFVEILAKHIENFEIPFYEGKGRLRIPFFAPPKFRYWEQNLNEKGKYDLFLEMGVPEEDMHYYMSEREINIATGKTDAMGKAL